MKFSCDSCHAQYMISDEKVGAAGVRVRCKKCGNVIHVKRVEAEAPPQEDATVVMTADKLAQIQDQLNAARGIGPDGTPSPPKVTADEIGQAFDSMFSDHTTDDGAVQPSQPPVAAPPVGPDGDPDRAETRVLTAGDIQRMASDLAPAPPPPGAFENEMTVAAPYTRPPSRPDAAVEWFVAIREEQVGPLTPAGVKERWDRGEVGPDTLVWCLGLPDWKPLSSVDELAHLVAPAPTATVRNGSGAPVQSSPSRAPAAPGPDDFKPEDSLAEFKPSAASALASLASMAQEEMEAADRAKAAPKPPEPEPALAPVLRSSPSRADLFADLPPPEAPPAAPAPVAVTAASSFGAPAPMPDAYEAPSRRGAAPAFGRPESSSLKLVAISVGVAVVILGLIGTLVWALYFKPQKEAEERRIAELAAAADAAKKAPAPPVPVAPTPPTPAPVAPTGAVAVAKPPPVAAPIPAPAVDDRKHRDHGGTGKHHEHGGHGEEAAAAPAPSAPTPAPAPAPAASGGGSGDDFLGGAGGNSIDKEFAKELDGNGDSAKAPAGGGPHHGGYIPPPPGQADLPQTLGQSDVMEVIVEHKGNFARCKTDHPGGGGTVVMHWRIKPDGHTTDVKRTGGELDNPPLAKCIQAQVAKLRFGQYKGPAMAPIDFPFSF